MYESASFLPLNHFCKGFAQQTQIDKVMTKLPHRFWDFKMYLAVESFYLRETGGTLPPSLVRFRNFFTFGSIFDENKTKKMFSRSVSLIDCSRLQIKKFLNLTRDGVPPVSTELRSARCGQEIPYCKLCQTPKKFGTLFKPILKMMK